MIGLLVLVIGAIYLALLLIATVMAYRWAARKGLPKSKRIVAATVGFLAVYLPVFWDHIPTLVMHKYYCKKEAGFWVYKTLEQWKDENPGVIDTLVANKGAPSTRQGDTVNYTDTYFLNQRINWVIDKKGPFLFNRWRWEEAVVDRNTNEALVRYVDFSTGNGHIGGEPELRFWLHSDGCIGGNAANHAQVLEFSKQLAGRPK